MKELQGKWNYQSFRSHAAEVQQLPEVDGQPQPLKVEKVARISGPWTPPSVMEFTTDDSGNVSGSASLGRIKFNIRGSVNPPSEDIPEGIYLVVTVDEKLAKMVTGINKTTVYNLQGSFLKDSDHIIGTVVSVSNDLGLQPDGTAGPFVLYPVSA